MPTFPSRPHAPTESTRTWQSILRQLRKRPFLLFGAPFLSLMIVSSFALQNLTKTRYDYQSSKTSTMSMEEGLGMNKDRKRVDIREEYFRLNNPGFKPSDSEDARLSSPSSPSSSNAIPEGTPKPPTSTSTSSRRKFSMAAVNNDEYEPIRVPRPAGTPEWGAGGGGEEAPVKGKRREDRWV